MTMLRTRKQRKMITAVWENRSAWRALRPMRSPTSSFRVEASLEKILALPPDKVTEVEDFVDFLTLPAYELFD